MKYREYFYLIILLFIAALNFNLFIKPYNLVCGGTNGLSIIINKITYIDYSIIILFINIIMFFLSIIFFNKKMTLSLIISTIFYPIFIRITSSTTIIIPSIFISVILTGIISGITGGFIYKLGFSSVGINLLGPLIAKYINKSIGTINIIINLIITILNLIFFGLNNFLFSLIIIYINGITINIILSKKISSLN